MLDRIKKFFAQSTKATQELSLKEGREESNLLSIHAKFSGDPFKDRELEYFKVAESAIAPLWNELIWPMIQHMDFTCVVDLAAGHGRNSAILRQYAQKLIIVDINKVCIDVCKQRFKGEQKISYLQNDGVSLRGIKDSSVSLIYCFDSMVHFDDDVIREYLKDFQRVLIAGGDCFCHHSNYTGNPGGVFQQSPHWRNFMSKELFAHYSIKAGLQVMEQKVIDWGGVPALDCLSVLRKPESQKKHAY
jgi:SAM-dependent methyltransferase